MQGSHGAKQETRDSILSLIFRFAFLFSELFAKQRSWIGRAGLFDSVERRAEICTAFRFQVSRTRCTTASTWLLPSFRLLCVEFKEANEIMNSIMNSLFGFGNFRKISQNLAEQFCKSPEFFRFLKNREIPTKIINIEHESGNIC